MNTTLRLTEFPNAEIVEKMSRHKWVYPEQRDMLYAYYQAIKNNKVQITYKAKKQNDKDLGRLYSTKPHMVSCASMWNRCRSTLFGKTEMDIDMVNAHPKMLLAMCQKYKEHFTDDQIETLSSYCSAREKMFENIYIDDNVIDEYNERNNETKTKKDFLKTLFTITLYGGSISTWEKSYQLTGDDYELSQEFETLQFELQHIAKTIVKIHPKSELAKARYIDKVTKKIKAKMYEDKEDGEIRIKEPKAHKLLSYLLQDKEREIVTDAIKKIKDAGFTVTCYSYDGFQILKNDKIYDFLKTINDESLGSQFIVKPFRDGLPMETKYLMDAPLDSFNATTMWRIGLKQKYDETTKQFIIEPTTHKGMLMKKEYFEKYAFYCDNQKKIVDIKGSGKYIYHGASQAVNDAYNNVEYIDNKGRRQLFCRWWMKNLERRTYERMECLPPPRVAPDYIYNLWKGYEIEEERYDPNADYSCLLEHFKNIAGNEDVVYEYLLNWFAWKVQKPGIKTEVALILYSQKEGTGKGFFAEEIIKAFLGKYKTEYFADMKSVKAITARFNTIPENIIGVVNEAKGSDSFGIIDEIKDFITCKTFNKELKGCTMERNLNALCDIILTTNNDNSMKISDSDRRFCIMECNEDVIGDVAYFKKLWKIIDNKPAMRGLFEFLKKRDITNFAPQLDKPKTKIYKEFAKSSMSPIELFWINEYERWNDNNEDAVEISCMGEYWERFNHFYSDMCPNKQHYYTKITFSKNSRKLDGLHNDIQIRKVDGQSNRCFVIHWEEFEPLYQKSL